MVRLTELIRNQNVFHKNKSDGKVNFVQNTLTKHELMPKRIYSCPVSPMIEDFGLKSISHLTTSAIGFGKNLSWTPPTEHHVKYKQHRKRVQNAKSIVNSQAPRRLLPLAPQRDPTYIELMESLCKHRNQRTFTKAPESVLQRAKYGPNIILPFEHRPECPFHKSQSSTQNVAAEVVAHTSIKRTKNKRKIGKTHNLHETTRKQSKVNIPERVLKRYHFLSAYLEKDHGLFRKVLRPKVYFDLEVKGVRPLGRIVIQLFTEACPTVVVEFVRACLEQKQELFTITRLFPPLWFEGELALDCNQTLTMPNIEHDMRVLDHGSSSGILSFPSRYVRGAKRDYLSFSISFKPLNVLNGKRIAFGRVRRGLSILDVIQKYGTYNGKPNHEIIVKKCGLLQN